MPQTIHQSPTDQVIGGTFPNRENAYQAKTALEKIGIIPSQIQMLVQNENKPEGIFSHLLLDRGFSENQARYYDQALRDGKILVTVAEVTDPAPVIDIFNKYEVG